MSDNNPDLVFQEVDDEVRRERLHTLWKTYGKYIIGAAVGIVLVVAGRESYNAYKRSVEEKNAAAFAEAVNASEAGGADAVAVWMGAVPNMKDGYHALAQLRLAAAQKEGGNVDAALATYDKLAADQKADNSLRDLAGLMAAMVIAGDKFDLDAARPRFEALAVKGQPWYYSALEQLALIDMQQGRDGEALTAFIILSDDSRAPQTVRTRASQFRAMMEEKTWATTPASPASVLPSDAETSATTDPNTEKGEK